ncbi:glycoside hydrolase family 16 protein [Nocardioides currus]|nr:glycoside hydrolase family 16 protein [Nocardioides currus]
MHAPPAGAAEHAAASKASKASKAARTTTGTLVALPPVVQPGTTPASPRNAGQVIATFAPARAGRVVQLERLVGSTWTVTSRKRTDAWGSVAFSAKPGTYRASTSTSTGAVVTTTPVVSRTWTPSFQDTFSSSSLDLSVWNDQRRERESVYAPRTCARADAAARRVEGGVLKLGLALDPTMADQTCTYTTDEGTGQHSYLLTSQVSTENTHLFGHGIVAARMKPQQAKGMHSGFWLLPEGTRFTDGDPSAGTEIDIMEFFGERPEGRETIGSFVSYYEPGWTSVQHGGMFGKARRALSTGARWWDEFHVFSVEWTPTEYIFRVDGREYHRELNAVSQARQYVVLSMLASDHELDDLTPDELGQTADVDWVRVYDADAIG